MSGRKKNRKHRHGQPPHELLSELSSLHELLGSDMEADIPLLDQVASPGSNDTAPNSAPAAREPRAPLAPPRPLEEADLPILFSPIDEELTDDYAPTLSDADRELLRPLQDLPRALATMPEHTTAGASEQVKEKPEPEQSEVRGSNADLKEEFQPGLFDAPRQQVPQQESPQAPSGQATQAPASAVERGQKPADKESAADTKPPETVHSTQPALARAASENPFLPPHIRARLTGGRIPKPDAEPAVAAPEPQPETGDTKDAEADEEPGIRDKLIEQLMAEQLPELERQLRANITALVNEIYPEDD